MRPLRLERNLEALVQGGMELQAVRVYHPPWGSCPLIGWLID